MMLALLLAGISTSLPGAAADLNTLMEEFRVTPSGLTPAPAFSLKTSAGKASSLADHRGHPVLLYFWATW
jgi:cytochrome oxidase Cu insertion factor (SCO1/SenC/PrrC family)